MGHKKQLEFLQTKFTQNGLAHAHIFSGQEGSGKKQAAKELVKFINCITKEKPCHTCVNCQLVEKEQFPDLMVVNSLQSDSSIKNEKDMMEIDVDQIRKVNNFLSLTSYYGGYKAVIIDQAERLNSEAQNCFLKTLEEPRGKTLIILISSKPEILLPTILSRCQSLAFFPEESYAPTSEEQQILKDLLPILNAELAIKFNFAKKANLEGNNINVMLKVLQRYFRGLMLECLGIGGSAKTQTYTLEKLKNILTLIEKLHTQLTFTNASPKLALEVLLMEI
jgi:DNA polymerase III delta' subunit